MDTRLKSDDEVDWTRFHSADESWRTRLLGDLSGHYAIPRYVELFLDTFGAERSLRFLELGAGNGEVPLQIRDLAPPCVDRYWVTELFHAGTRFNDQGEVITSGGRVLGVTALGDSLAQARDKAYSAVKKIHFEGQHVRADIALSV